MTGLDLHKTLLDIAHFNKDFRTTKEGISLFNAIPKKRNCYNQNVKSGCSCRVGDSKLDDDNYEEEKLFPFKKPKIKIIKQL